jgi:hypothetical protein
MIVVPRLRGRSIHLGDRAESRWARLGASAGKPAGRLTTKVGHASSSANAPKHDSASWPQRGHFSSPIGRNICVRSLPAGRTS